MKPRLCIITLAVMLSTALHAQTPSGIAAMDKAVSSFLSSSKLMTMDTHWSHNQQQWAFKHVAATGTTARPAALTALTAAFAEQTAQAASSYFHSVDDGEKPFAALVYNRRDNYYHGISGTFDIKDNYNFLILNFRDTTGLTSYGVMWFEDDLTDRNGQKFHITDGQLFKFYGGIWQMSPFMQENPWEPKDIAARRPIGSSQQALYETLEAQTRYLSDLYRQNKQSGNEQNCDAIAYLLKTLLDGYKGRIILRQWSEVKSTLPMLSDEEQHSRRGRMIEQAVNGLLKKLEPLSTAVTEYEYTTGGPFYNPEEEQKMTLKYSISKDGALKPDDISQVSLSGKAPAGVRSITIRGVFPKDNLSYVVDVDNGQFMFLGDFHQGRLLEVSDSEGHRLLFFADSTATTVDLTQTTLTGSPQNERFADCQRRLNALKPELRKYVSNFGFNHEFEVMDAEGFSSLAADAHRLQMQFIDENTDNLIPAWYLADNFTEMTLDELSHCLSKDRPYSNHIALQPVWRWYEGLQKRQTGQRFHDGECVDTAGVRHRLADFIGHGDYVVLNFWSSNEILTRSSCKVMKQIAREHQGKNLRVIGFALDSDKQTWRRYVKARNLTYEHLSAPATDEKTYEQWASEVVQAHGIQALPETIVFDPKGRIVCTGIAGESLKAMVRSFPLKMK